MSTSFARHAFGRRTRIYAVFPSLPVRRTSVARSSFEMRRSTVALPEQVAGGCRPVGKHVRADRLIAGKDAWDADALQIDDFHGSRTEAVVDQPALAHA